MSDCSKHKKSVAGISDMRILAEQIGDLRYDTLRKLLNEVAMKLHNDSLNDVKGGKFKLANALGRASNNISLAAMDIKEAWQISKPFMKQ